MGDRPLSFHDFVQQLKRRRVFRVAAVYAVAAFAVIEVADPVLDMAGAPAWMAKVVLVVVALGFPVALALAWAFDITPGGIIRTESEGGPTAPRSRIMPLALISVITVLVLAGVGWRLFGPARVAPLDPRAVAVLPFRVSADPSLAYLREGMVDLLSAALNGDTATRAVDPRAVVAAWRDAGGGDGVDFPPGVASRIARSLGAGRILLGDVVGTPQRITVNVALYDASNADLLQRISRASPADSLGAIVDDLIGQLLAREAGLPEHELAALTTRSLPALRAYLSGSHNYRLGRLIDASADLEEALRQDSTFALAAIQLWMVTGWGFTITEPGTAARALRLAWTARDRLSGPDRLFLDAIAGPRYPELSSRAELLVARQRALDAAPDRPEALFMLARSYSTENVEAIDWENPSPDPDRDQAVEYLRRALGLDSTYAAPMHFLTRIELMRGDSAAVRRIVSRYLRADSTSEIADLSRWMMAVATQDEQALVTVRARMPSMDPNALGFIIGGALHHGVDMEGAEAAIDALRANAGTQRERLVLASMEREFLASRGRLREISKVDSMAAGDAATQIMAQTGLPRDAVMRLSLSVNHVVTGLFYAGDTTGIGTALQTLDAVSRNPPPAIPPRQASLLACSAGLAHSLLGQPAAARSAAARIRGIMGDSLSAARGLNMCTATIDAAVATAELRPDAHSLADHADTLWAGINARAIRNMYQLVLARTYDALGDPAAGLRVIRRSHELNNPAYFLATMLRDEGRLAVRAGDRDAAIRAYRHYLVLRTQPDPGLEEEVRQVREDLAALVAERH